MTPNIFNPYRYAGAGADGLMTYGGRNALQDNGSDQCETYDLTTWSNQNVMTQRLNGFAGNGTPTDALAICGNNDTISEGFWTGTILWDGTNWATSYSVSGYGRRNNYGGGQSSSGMTFAGTTGSGASTIENYAKSSETFNGSSWSSGTDYTTNIREGNSGGKTSEDQIGMNGLTSGGLSAVCSRWDNVSWTSAGTVPYVNRNVGADSNDDCSEACSFGGYTNEEYAATLDDTTWTQENDLDTPVNYPSVMYLDSSNMWAWGGIAAGGYDNGGQYLDGSGGTWATATGSLNTAQGYGNGCSS